MRVNPTRDRFVATLCHDDPVIDETVADQIYEALRQEDLRNRGKRERVISLDRYCERQLKAKGGMAKA